MTIKIQLTICFHLTRSTPFLAHNKRTRKTQEVTANKKRTKSEVKLNYRFVLFAACVCVATCRSSHTYCWLLLAAVWLVMKTTKTYKVTAHFAHKFMEILLHHIMRNYFLNFHNSMCTSTRRGTSTVAFNEMNNNNITIFFSLAGGGGGGVGWGFFFLSIDFDCSCTNSFALGRCGSI